MQAPKEDLSIEIQSVQSGTNKTTCTQSCAHCPLGIKPGQNFNQDGFPEAALDAVHAISNYAASRNKTIHDLIVYHPGNVDKIPAFPIEVDIESLSFPQKVIPAKEVISDLVYELKEAVKNSLRDYSGAPVKLRAGFVPEFDSEGKIVDIINYILFAKLAIIEIASGRISKVSRNYFGSPFSQNALSPDDFDKQFDPTAITVKMQLFAGYTDAIFEDLSGELVDRITGNHTKQNYRGDPNPMFDLGTTSTYQDETGEFTFSHGMRVMQGGKPSKGFTPLHKTLMNVMLLPDTVWVNHMTSFANDPTVRIPYSDFMPMVQEATTGKRRLMEVLHEEIKRKRALEK